MDATKYMILVKNEILTEQIIDLKKLNHSKGYEITFQGGKTYHYSSTDVMILKNPTPLNPADYYIRNKNGQEFFQIQIIYEFQYQNTKYWQIYFLRESRAYNKADLLIKENCLKDRKSASTYEYLKELSALSDIKNENGEILLKKQYSNLSFIPEESALSAYLNPDKLCVRKYNDDLIYPFGCNESQYLAVCGGMNHQISVIQGPPGTGKTQTILNLIANLIIQGKTVLVVSNNNSATQNVLDKLSEDQYGMDFLVASLGRSENKNDFIKNQTGNYPNLSSWNSEENQYRLLSEIKDLTNGLQRMYRLQREIAQLKEEKYQIEIEAKHFEVFLNETAADYQTIQLKNELPSSKIMEFLQEIQYKSGEKGKLSLWFKIKSIFYYGIRNWNFYKQDLLKITTVLQDLYYKETQKEIEKKIQEKERELSRENSKNPQVLKERSLVYLKNYLANKYDWKNSRKIFTSDDIFRKPEEVLKEYPVVLSTTFSARTSLGNGKVLYDYVIMDEASQVDLVTGALALSCAQNAVIVGDLNQLANVITKDIEHKANKIMERYQIPKAYDYAHNSFLKSVLEALPFSPSILLKEHYRCHPRIIAFCNQKFYHNELVIMTKDDQKNQALKAIKTVKGNHTRGHYNQRQIDIIKEEVLPNLSTSHEEIGIIAPYNDQVNELKKQIPEIESATVHKFQGREKDVIILSTVDDKISDFTDDPYLLNVAVSRAKKQLILIVSGNDQKKRGNLLDLISYIQYNNMEVINSQVYSVFDYLYSQYREAREGFLKSKKKISQYDSENLAYNMLQEILKEKEDFKLGCFIPLSMIIKDLKDLSEDEIRYVLHPNSHIDFLVYNKFSKQPVLAIEVDGYFYHKKGTAQYDRDRKKEHILEIAGLKLLRLSTNGSNEKEKVWEALGE